MNAMNGECKPLVNCERKTMKSVTALKRSRCCLLCLWQSFSPPWPQLKFIMDPLKHTMWSAFFDCLKYGQITLYESFKIRAFFLILNLWVSFECFVCILDNLTFAIYACLKVLHQSISTVRLRVTDLIRFYNIDFNKICDRR